MLNLTQVWPGALALLGHLHESWRGVGPRRPAPKEVYELSNVEIVELGCGTPFLAAGMASLGAKVRLTLPV